MTHKLTVTGNEREFFQLGETLGRGGFASADLAQQATKISRLPGRLTQLQRLAALETLAHTSRMNARQQFGQALALMTALHAPATALAPVRAAITRLESPVVLAGDAKAVSKFSARAALTLGALDEFSALSALPDAAPIQHWITSPSVIPSGHVWYAEGLIAALTVIAARNQMPELLPPVKEIATDLRGLLDWLALRLPENPSPAQTALQTEITDFLSQTSRTGKPQSSPLSQVQLQSLGAISRGVQEQVMGIDSPSDGWE